MLRQNGGDEKLQFTIISEFLYAINEFAIVNKSFGDDTKTYFARRCVDLNIPVTRKCE